MDVIVLICCKLSADDVLFSRSVWERSEKRGNYLGVLKSVVCMVLVDWYVFEKSLVTKYLTIIFKQTKCIHGSSISSDLKRDLAHWEPYREGDIKIL